MAVLESNNELIEKAKILKEALTIIDKLAESDFDEIGNKFTEKDFDFEELQDLITRAKKLKRNKLWIM